MGIQTANRKMNRLLLARATTRQSKRFGGGSNFMPQQIAYRWHPYADPFVTLVSTGFFYVPVGAFDLHVVPSQRASLVRAATQADHLSRFARPMRLINVGLWAVNGNMGWLPSWWLPRHLD